MNKKGYINMFEIIIGVVIVSAILGGIGYEISQAYLLLELNHPSVSVVTY